MTSFMIVFIIVILNTIVATFILIWDILNKNGKIAYAHFAVIFLCPIVGGLFYLGSFLLYKSKLRDQTLEYADISFDASRHVKKQKGNFIEEVDILPLEEAFTVSNTKDRRKALLATLKKEDQTKNIPTILRGLNNEDSETRHYAASFVLSTSTDYLNLLSKLKDEYNDSEDQVGAARNYLAGLKSFMQSDIMDKIDKVKYIRIHSEVMGWMYKHFREEVTLDDYVYQIGLLLEANNYDDAKIWSDRAIHSFPEEDAPYHSTMKMYYQFGDVDKFLDMLKEIMASNINISNETLQTIRFFNYNPTL